MGELNPATGTEPRLFLGTTPWLEDWAGEARSLAQQATFAEKLGLDSFWLPESHFTGPSANPAPLLRLAAVAGATRRLRLGTTSLLLPVRHPIHVAEEIAVLDRLSAGRVVVGIGRGFRPALFEAFEVPRLEKRQRFEAALGIILQAWRGEPIAWEGGDDDAAPQRAILISPLPVQKPHPPVWVAAFGPKAVAQAGRLGLPYLASPVEPLAILIENYTRHREAMPAATDTTTLPVPVMRTVFVSRDRAQLRQVRESLTRQSQALGRSPLSSVRRAADSAVEDWALLGEPQAVAENIERYRDQLGLTHLIARAHVPDVEPRALAESLALLAEVLNL